VFDTVYPGWYQGRTPHIHVKVHVAGQEVHTGQLYFDEAVTRTVYRRAPYASHGEPTTVNSSDGIYAQGGRQSTPDLTRRADGYVGRLVLGVRA
jgi:protocatechuate 3,4-dioxygenase beta subunit